MLKESLIHHSPAPNYRYIDRYIYFIKKCQLKTFTGRIEKHHIIPKSFGGGMGKNIISVSPRHHYIAHVLLARATGSPKMIKALHKMVYSRTGDVCRNYRISSRVYEFLRNEHSKVVSQYSRHTVTAKNILTGEVKRVPMHEFYERKGILYSGVKFGSKDSDNTKKLKSIAAKKPRIVKQKTRTRSLAASKYSYITPKGYCENSSDLLKLYKTFTKNTLLVIDDSFVISPKFASIHCEFKEFIGKALSDIGFKRVNR